MADQPWRVVTVDSAGLPVDLMRRASPAALQADQFGRIAAQVFLNNITFAAAHPFRSIFIFDLV